MSTTLQVVAVLGFLTGQVLSVNNGLARTPQMGWVSNFFSL
jgi:hypothetical protein